MKANMSNMKTNLVGLGNYINNINGDLSQLLVSFDGYAKKMSTELTGIKGNISLVSKEMMGTKSVGDDVKKKLESVEFMSTSVRNDVTSLTTKIYNIKTSLFEQTNEMSSLKATQTQMQVRVLLNINLNLFQSLLLVAFIGFTNVYGPSTKPTACRPPTYSLSTGTRSNQA